MLADELDYLVGVDTHRDQHAVAIVDARTGAVIAQTTTAASAGRDQAMAVQVMRLVKLDEGSVEDEGTRMLVPSFAVCFGVAVQPVFPVLRS
jgi:hypothetical protein